MSMTTFVPAKAESLLDPEIEAAVKNCLVAEYSAAMKNPVPYVEMLMEIDPHVERFGFLFNSAEFDLTLREQPFLCSGFSLGSEMIQARAFGFHQIHGVEVDATLVKSTRRRIGHIEDMYPIHYGGDWLPYKDGIFGVIVSGHVIEHTNSPQNYLNECMRVLVKGGVISLEFPNRFHRIELHTGLFSFEWLPTFIRNNLLRLVSSSISPLSKFVKDRYLSILQTNLQQISLGSIQSCLNRSGYSYRISSPQRPAPGIIRCVIQKTA